MNESGYYENTNLLLQLLDKAEQILSLINLPESTITKYNQLKELTFEKLNLNFRPLERSSKMNFKTDKKETLSSSRGLPANEIIQRLKLQNHKKNIIIENTFDMIDKFKLDGNAYMKNHLAENFSFNLIKQIERPSNFSVNNISKCP